MGPLLTNPALILRGDAVAEAEVHALTYAAAVNVDPFWPGPLAKARAAGRIGSVVCSAGAGGPALAAGAAPAGGPAPHSVAGAFTYCPS